MYNKFYNKEIKNDTSLFEELRFSKYFYENKEKVLKCKLIHKEYQLYPALRVMQKLSNSTEDTNLRAFGRIDFVIEYKKTNYVVEVKYNEGSNSSFWDALKVIGYSKYYSFQTGIKNVKPAIFIPIESIKLEHEYVCSELGITLFEIIKKDNEYSVNIHNSAPKW